MSSKIAIACALSAALSLVGARGFAADAPPVHQGPWPIYGGRQHQPTQDEIGAHHLHDVTPNQASEVDRLYDQLMSSSNKLLKDEPALAR
jgi:hypothetical protein